MKDKTLDQLMQIAQGLRAHLNAEQAREELRLQLDEPVLKPIPQSCSCWPECGGPALCSMCRTFEVVQNKIVVIDLT